MKQIPEVATDILVSVVQPRMTRQDLQMAGVGNCAIRSGSWMVRYKQRADSRVVLRL